MTTTQNSLLKKTEELWTAVRLGDIVKIKEFLEEGVNVHGTNAEQEGLLHIALEHQDPTTRLGMATVLLEHGIDVNAVNHIGKTPLHYECSLGCDVHVIGLLLDKGAHVNHADKMGRTALFVACKKEAWRANGVRLLLERGADVHFVSSFTKGGVLHFASYNYSPEEVINVLLEYGVNIHAVDSEGKNALHFACAAKASQPQLQFLVNIGVDYTVKDINGKTPVDIAKGTSTEMWLREIVAEREQQWLKQTFQNEPVSLAQTYRTRM